MKFYRQPDYICFETEPFDRFKYRYSAEAVFCILLFEVDRKTLGGGERLLSEHYFQPCSFETTVEFII